MSARTTKPAGPSGKRRRTRSAIVAAAAELLARGATPSVAEVAEAAEVSRRTVYMYFPTLEQLLIDATLETIARKTAGSPDRSADRDGDSDDDVEVRVERMARWVQRMSADTEHQGRALMRLTAGVRRDSRSSATPPRGYRRVEWIERALSPLRGQLAPVRFERLVSALAMVIGWEALIVERDIRGLTLQQAEDVSAWAACALVKASLDELRETRRGKPDETGRGSRARGAKTPKSR